MSVTKLKNGVYRHDQTGFIVHEVRSLQDIIKCNGFLVENSAVATKWQWLAGRDMRDFLLSTGASTITEVTALSQMVQFGSRGILSGDANATCVPAAFHKSTDANTFNRIYGLVTGLDAGFGAGYYTEYVPGTVNPTLIGAKDFAAANPGKGDLNYSQGPVYVPHEDIVGGGLISFGSKYSWQDFAKQYFASLDYQDKAEVKSKIAAAKLNFDSYMSKIPGFKAGTEAKFDVYVILRKSGKHQWVPPVPSANSAYQSNPNVYSETVNFHGARAYFNDGRGITLPVMRDQQASQFNFMLKDIFPASALNPANVDTTVAGQTTKINSYPLITQIDGVKIERMLGGASALLLGDTGEANPAAGALQYNVKTSDVILAYVSSIRLGPNSVAARPTTADGGVVSEQVWKASLETTYASMNENSFAKCKFSNYDTHGFGFGLFLAVCTFALEPNKAMRRSVAMFEHHRLPRIGDTSVITAAGTIGNYFAFNDVVANNRFLADNSVPATLKDPNGFFGV